MKPLFRIGIMLFVAAVLAVIFIAGCASAPALRTESSTSSIRAAEEAGAANVPKASLHLQMAKEELELARRLAENDKREEAVSMLSRAEVDADLAIVLSHGDAEKSEAVAAMERVRQLRQDNQ